MVFSVGTETRRRHEPEILRYYYDTVKSIAGDKFSITYDQVVYLYKRLVALLSIFLVSWIPVMMTIGAKSEGDQSKEDARGYRERVNAVYGDSVGALLG